MVFEWSGRAREDLQNNLWGPVCLCTVYALSTGPRAGRLLPAASCFVQRIVKIVGIATVLVGTRFVCCTVPIAADDRATGRDRRGCGCRACPCARVHRSGGGVVGGCVIVRATARRVSGPIGFRFDDHLRSLNSGYALVVRHYERGVLLFCDTHVVTSVRLLHYVTRALMRKPMVSIYYAANCSGN